MITINVLTSQERKLNYRELRDLLRFEDLVNGRARTGSSFLTSHLLLNTKLAQLISLCYWNNS